MQSVNPPCARFPKDGFDEANPSIEMPVHGTSVCVNTDYAVVKNLKSMFSWNDGFDTHANSKNVIYKNCTAIGNCGQAFSNHDLCTSTYENCAGQDCASSGACFDVPGVDYGDKLFNKENWAEYQKASGLDANSEWLDPGLAGNLNSVLPAGSPLKKKGKFYNSKVRVAAELPENVWKLYQETSDSYAFPSGIFRKK